LDFLAHYGNFTDIGSAETYQVRRARYE